MANKMEAVMDALVVGHECDFCDNQPSVTIEIRGEENGVPFTWHVCLACLQQFIRVIYFWTRGQEKRGDAQEEADAGAESGEVSAGSE